MLIEDVYKLSPIDRFTYWVKERHEIYLRRKAGQPRPWTDDEILQKFFFTNPFREHDKTTVWFRENVRDPMRNDPGVLMATVIFRWFNLPATGQVLLEHDLFVKWDEEKAIDILLQQWDNGENPVFGAGYIIKAGNGPKGCKIPNVCESITNVWKCQDDLVKTCRETNSMEALWGELKEFPNLGPFNTYEIVCDVRYTALLENAIDKMTWANMGPGAKRGLNRVLGRPKEAPLKNWEWKVQLQRLIKLLQDLKLRDAPPIEAREVEHSLCEGDKYVRALSCDGHMKRKYPGEYETD